MTIFKNGQLSKNEKSIIKSITIECSDIFGDCYMTKNNLRLFIKENLDIVYESLKKGNKIVYEENQGFILITGYADNFSRKYIKILTKDEDTTNRLVKILHWNIKEDLWVKIKKNNPVKRILERNGFRFAGDRGKELLMYRKFITSRPIKQKVEDEEKPE